ncbi:hypothetical protein IMCC3135_06145 [Granulosicoccus antarcticus IMCC3135]|uniref:Uncharacterized protein n=1 Tax=Granulosicoccus antarcticus IMCC3135 TaxID=1192854 RepID=A0A2Z2NN44_9GAMM|nr:hypothetical protein IMCC3135_06145 [Granulosicoccus antarcticus IMCC3135]
MFLFKRAAHLNTIFSAKGRNNSISFLIQTRFNTGKPNWLSLRCCEKTDSTPFQQGNNTSDEDLMNFFQYAVLTKWQRPLEARQTAPCRNQVNVQSVLLFSLLLDLFHQAFGKLEQAHRNACPTLRFNLTQLKETLATLRLPTCKTNSVSGPTLCLPSSTRSPSILTAPCLIIL